MPKGGTTMPPHAINGLMRPLRKLVRRLSGDQEGVAAIEFAMIVPILALMFIGAVELSQAITVDRRITQVASSTGDLIARSEKQISQTEIGDIMKVGGYIMKPYTQDTLEIIVRNVVSSPTNATVAKQSWSCTFKATGQTQTCACSSTNYSLPGNLVSTNDSVVISEVTYSYKPLLFDYFMKQSSGGGGGTYPLAETVYLKPRGQAAMLLQSNNTPCPAPSF
jgi:Flp pilus assembly protein TadG